MRRLLVLAAGVLAAGAAASSAHAATIDVTTTTDAVAADGRCSLREAITSANSESEAARVAFSKQSKAGANKRKLSTRRFRPGRYRAVLVATDAAGNRSKPKRLTFRIKR